MGTCEESDYETPPRPKTGFQKISEAFGKSISDIASPDAPMTTNEKGGSQSDIPVRFDLIDGPALFEMAKVLDQGAKKYGENNWRLIPIADHLNHLLMHAYAYLSGDTTDEHLSHILCRATFALGVSLQDESDTPDLKTYLDQAIRQWRFNVKNAKNDIEEQMAKYYVDAFQSVRMTMFNELLPQE